MALLDVANFWQPMLTILQSMTQQRILKPEHRDLLLVDADFPGLLERMTHFSAPDAQKWLDTVKTDLR
jgi:hypothetical protein